MNCSLPAPSRLYIFAAILALLGLHVLQISAAENDYANAQLEGEELDRTGNNDKINIRLPRTQCAARYTSVVPSVAVQISIAQIIKDIFPNGIMNLLIFNKFMRNNCGLPTDELVNIPSVGLTEPGSALIVGIIVGVYLGPGIIQNPQTGTPKVRVVDQTVRNLVAENLSKCVYDELQKQLTLSKTIHPQKLVIAILVAIDIMIENTLSPVVANMASEIEGPASCIAASTKGPILGVVSTAVGAVLSVRVDLARLLCGVSGTVKLVIERLLDSVGNLLGGVVLTVEQLKKLLEGTVGVVVTGVVGLLDGLLGGLFGGRGCNTCPTYT